MSNLDAIKKFLTKENAKTNIRNITSNHCTYKGRTLQTTKIEVLTPNQGYKTIYIIFKLNNKDFIIHDFYLHKIHEVHSKLDIFSIINDCLLIDVNDKPGIGTSIMKL